MYHRIFFLSLFLGGYLVSYCVFSQTDPYLRINHLIYSAYYPDAIKLCDSIIKTDPDYPKPYTFKALAQWWQWISDQRNPYYPEQFYETLQTAKEVAENYYDKNENDANAYLFLGGIYGYLGRYHALKNNWFQAYRAGQKGKNYLEEAVTMNPHEYDAYYGLGIYHYYAAQLPTMIKPLSFLLGLKGDKVKGLEELRLAKDKGTYLKDDAAFFLNEIYIEFEKKYSEGIQLSTELMNKYPTNPSFYSMLCWAHDGLEQYQRSSEILENLLQKNNIQYVNQHAKADIYIHLGHSYRRMKNFDHARTNYRKAETILNSMQRNKSQLYYYMGLCEEKDGKKEEAMKYYQRVLDCEELYGFQKAAGKKIQELQKKN